MGMGRQSVLELVNPYSLFACLARLCTNQCNYQITISPLPKALTSAQHLEIYGVEPINGFMGASGLTGTKECWVIGFFEEVFYFVGQLADESTARSRSNNVACWIFTPLYYLLLVM